MVRYQLLQNDGFNCLTPGTLKTKLGCLPKVLRDYLMFSDLDGDLTDEMEKERPLLYSVLHESDDGGESTRARGLRLRKKKTYFISEDDGEKSN